MLSFLICISLFIIYIYIYICVCVYVCVCVCVRPDIGRMVRVFANGLGESYQMVLDATLLNTQHYKVRIIGKVEQSKEKSSALPYILVE